MLKDRLNLTSITSVPFLSSSFLAHIRVFLSEYYYIRKSKNSDALSLSFVTHLSFVRLCLDDLLTLIQHLPQKELAWMLFLNFLLNKRILVFVKRV